MPSLCCLQRQRHKGGPVGSCEKQGQARTKPRGGVACSRMQPLQRQCSGSAGGQWPACCSIQRAAGWPLPTAFLPQRGSGASAHTHSHLPAVLLLAHPALPCSPLPCVIGSECKSKSKQAILQADNWILSHCVHAPSRGPFSWLESGLSLSQMNHNHNASPKTFTLFLYKVQLRYLKNNLNGIRFLFPNF